jgi:hypothetical protein
MLIMAQKNEAKRKYLQAKIRASCKIYVMKRTEANRVCGDKKINRINNKIKNIEEASNKNKTRKFFKEAQFFNKQQMVSPIHCKDKYNNILSEHGDILQR